MDERKVERAIEMFCNRASIRQVVKEVGISRGSAHQLQKYQRCADIFFEEKTRVLTGTRADGSYSYYETKEMQPQWRDQPYGDEISF